MKEKRICGVIVVTITIRLLVVLELVILLVVLVVFYSSANYCTIIEYTQRLRWMMFWYDYTSTQEEWLYIRYPERTRQKKISMRCGTVVEIPK